MTTAALLTGYDVHGVGVEVRLRTPELAAAVTARLAAFPAGQGEARLVLTEAPPPPEAVDGLADGRVVYSSARSQVEYRDADDTLLVRVGAAGALADLAAGTTTVWGGAQDTWAASHPCVALPLTETLRRNGLFPVHAAGIVSTRGAVLLQGPSGAGKSTTALLMARCGYGFLADDTVALRGGLVHGWPDEVDVTPETVALLPDLADEVGATPAPGWPKHPLPPSVAARTEPVLTPLPPVALLLLRRTGAPRTSARPARPDEVLRALVGDVLLTRHDVVAAHLAALQRLALDVAAWTLDVGPDRAETAELLTRELGLPPVRTDVGEGET